MSNVRLNLLSLIYILMNTRKDYVTIHLQLTEIDVLEVVTLLNLYNRIRVPKKTKDLNLNVTNIITEIIESKILAKHEIMQMYFDGRKCNTNQKWNKNKCRCEYKTP